MPVVVTTILQVVEVRNPLPLTPLAQDDFAPSKAELLGYVVGPDHRLIHRQSPHFPEGSSLLP